MKMLSFHLPIPIMMEIKNSVYLKKKKEAKQKNIDYFYVGLVEITEGKLNGYLDAECDLIDEN